MVLVARVGNDLFGRDMLEHFRNERHRHAVRHAHGCRFHRHGRHYLVDAAGRNTIVVAPGANGLLTAADVEAARSAIETGYVLVCQQEVPAEANLVAMRIAAGAGVPVVFNPAPAGDGMPREAYQFSTILCPNESEAAATDRPTRGNAAKVEAAARGDCWPRCAKCQLSRSVSAGAWW